LVVLAAFIVLIIPHFIRFAYFNNYMLGNEPYRDALVAEALIEGHDPEHTIYHSVIAIVGKYTGVLTAINAIPFIAGILSTILFYLTLKRFKIKLENRFMATLLWIISPIFIYGFTVSNPFSIILLLNIAGFHYFVVQRYSYVSLIFFALIPFFGWINSLLTAALVLMYTIQNKDKSMVCIAGIAVMVLISILVGQGATERVVDDNIIQDNIAGLGALIGFNVFVLLLAGIGIIKSWKSKNAWLYFLFILLLGLSYYSSEYKIILNILISLYAAIGFAALRKMQWDLVPIRNLTILLLGLGLVFSSVSYVNRLSFMEPGPLLVDSLLVLRAESDSESVILSHKDNGFWIEFFSSRRALLNSRSDDTAINETTNASAVRIIP